MALLAILVLIIALPGLANMPVIDRDEARYAQATVQMIETGDYVNIRFQDRARNKKPAGAYWAQAASVNMLSDVNKRPIWAHRLPSVLAALLAILATYWGGTRMLGREVAFIGAGLLAVSMIFVFEAHIAKTDALLCGFSALTLASLGHLRNHAPDNKGRCAAVLFWFALGCAVMIKGPLLPIVVILTIICLLIWERKGAWLKPLLFFAGPLLFLAIILPWGILIWQATDGAFFTDAIGGDLVSKLKDGQERHGGVPGYYSLAVWITFWPGSLVLLPGLAFAFRAAKNKALKDTPVAGAARLLLAWILPFWLLLEFTPTKLPHYILPVYPALALLCGASILTLSHVKEFSILRRVSSAFYLVISIALAGGILFAQSYYGNFPTWSFAVLGLVIILSLLAVINLWGGKIKLAMITASLSAIILYVSAYQFIMPSLVDLRVTDQVKTALNSYNYSVKQKVFSPHYSEPSLVYRLGTHIIVGKEDEDITNFQLGIGDFIILDYARETTKQYAKKLSEMFQKNGLCMQPLEVIKGTNYSKGDKVELGILRLKLCMGMKAGMKAEIKPSKLSEKQSTKPVP